MDNYTRLGAMIKLHLVRSCSLTLALKYKLRHKAKVFKKFGSELTCPDTNKKINVPQSFKRTGQFNINAKPTGAVVIQRWNKKLTRSNIGKACVICGVIPAEMHHIRQVSDIEQKYKKGKIDFFTKQMIGINRKQVPLCKEHHKKLHQNQLSQTEINAFSEGVNNLHKKKEQN